MRFCSETEKIPALRSGNLTEEQAFALRRHASQCPVCQQEMLIEDEIERELARGSAAPEIEGRVIRELKLLRLADTEKPTSRFYQYLAISALSMILGFLIMPYLLHFSVLRSGPYFALTRFVTLVVFLKSHLPVMFVIGNALMAVSLFLTYPRFRRALLSFL